MGRDGLGGDGRITAISLLIDTSTLAIRCAFDTTGDAIFRNADSLDGGIGLRGSAPPCAISGRPPPLRPVHNRCPHHINRDTRRSDHR